MTEPDYARPGSSATGHHGSSIPSSPRPSVASRASGSSLRRERERQEDLAHARPASTAQSHSRAQSPPPSNGSPPVDGVAQTDQEPRTFSQFFTLLSSSDYPSQRQTTHHPVVHYIFADDDPETLTNALAQHDQEVGHDEAEQQPGSIRPGDRAIILDMGPAPDGTRRLEVTWASSLAPDWAVVSTRVSQMEGGDGGNTPAGEHNTGLMLKIQGVSIEPSLDAAVPWGKTPSPEAELQSSGGSGTRQQHRAPAPGDYTDLLADFDNRMGLLRRVVESGVDGQGTTAPAEKALDDTPQLARQRAGTGASVTGEQDE